MIVTIKTEPGDYVLDPGDYKGTYDPDAGHLALDFANTLSNRNREEPHEWLNTFSNLVAWGQLVGIFPEKLAGQLLKESTYRQAEAEETRLKAITVREVIYRVFSSAAAGQVPDRDDIESFNDFLPETFSHLRIIPDAEVFTWAWQEPVDSFDRLIWPIVKAAADLLTSDELDRVGECQGEGCGWLFIDMSRNRSRRWCSMNDCGNREKARRHYHRKRKE